MEPGDDDEESLPEACTGHVLLWKLNPDGSKASRNYMQTCRPLQPHTYYVNANDTYLLSMYVCGESNLVLQLAGFFNQHGEPCEGHQKPCQSQAEMRSDRPYREGQPRPPWQSYPLNKIMKSENRGVVDWQLRFRKVLDCHSTKKFEVHSCHDSPFKDVNLYFRVF